MIRKLTKEQAVIISGFTGILCGEFSELHNDVEKRLGRSVQTFEFGGKEFIAEVKKLYESDFIEMGTVDTEAAKAQAVPEGFVLVPQEPTELFKEHLKNHLFDLWAGDHGCDWDGFVNVDAINHNTIWKMMIEAQEQN